MYKLDETIIRDLKRVTNDRNVSQQHRNTILRAISILSGEDDDVTEITTMSPEKRSIQRKQDDLLLRMQEEL